MKKELFERIASALSTVLSVHKVTCTDTCTCYTYTCYTYTGQQSTLNYERKVPMIKEQFSKPKAEREFVHDLRMEVSKQYYTLIYDNNTEKIRL